MVAAVAAVVVVVGAGLRLGTVALVVSDAAVGRESTRPAVKRDGRSIRCSIACAREESVVGVESPGESMLVLVGG